MYLSSTRHWVNFAEQFSSLITIIYNCLVVCHCHDFSPKQLPSSKPFLIYLFFLYDSFIMSETNYVILWGCIFILINNRIIGNLGAAMQSGSKTQLSGLRKQAKPSWSVIQNLLTESWSIHLQNKDSNWLKKAEFNQLPEV